jgi:hypothetical protein
MPQVARSSVHFYSPVPGHLDGDMRSGANFQFGDTGKPGLTYAVGAFTWKKGFSSVSQLCQILRFMSWDASFLIRARVLVVRDLCPPTEWAFVLPFCIIFVDALIFFSFRAKSNPLRWS